MSPNGLSRYRAERLLRKDFAGLRSKVLAVVRSQLCGKGVELGRADLEACYAQAWHGLYAAVLDGEAIENPSAWLVLVTFRRAIDEARASSRSHIGAGGQRDVQGELAGEYAGAPFDRDLAGELDDRARLRQVFEGMRATLSKRECEAAALCYLQGLTRAEAAERMGISEARMGKLMEGTGPGRPGVAGKVGSLLDTIKAGGWCEEQASLMRAYAFGILDPEGERHALATAHCRECPACRAHVASLRGLASVLPLPLLSPLAFAGGAGATSGAAGTGAGSTRIAASGLRIGGGAGNGWGGLGGSLTAKLAAGALVTLGAGYAVLGSRAHGSPPVAHTTHAAPPLASSGTLARALVSTLGAAAHRGNTTPHSRAPKPPRPERGSHPISRATPREFLPERFSPEQAGGTPTSTPAPPASPTGASRAAGEFGIE